MKVIISNWVYDWGSTGFILRDLKTGLQSYNIDVKVACGVNKGEYDKDVFCFNNTFFMKCYLKLTEWGWPKFHGSTIATRRFINMIKREKPNLVHLHLLHCGSLNLYYLLDFLGKNNIKTVITHHAELYYTGGCGHTYDCNAWIDSECRGCYDVREAIGAKHWGNPHLLWQKMYAAFNVFSVDNLLFTAVSPWVKSRMMMSPITKRFDCDVVFNGIETSIFYRRNVNSHYFADNNKGKPVVLFVSANFDPLSTKDVKGSRHVVQIARQLSDVKFVVVATSYKNIENLPDNIFFWGRAKSQDELAELYSNADITMLTSRRETFSMICAESLCCGTPIVGFYAGGPESIALKDYSCFVKNGDTKALGESIKCFLNKSFDRHIIAEEASTIYSKENMVEGYLQSYKKLLGDI